MARLAKFSFLQPPVTSSLFGPNIFPQHLFSNTLSVAYIFQHGGHKVILNVRKPFMRMFPLPIRAPFMLETTEFADLCNLCCTPLKGDVAAVYNKECLARGDIKTCFQNQS
jgi:hypothetical protein